ncbi:hypothetical protein C1645_834893 [Glomus cerebriforme]|uniref:Uncharacterized protein n=1 Tax=Glomus cerebriforme TaxID=658196 RepID=A0A397SB80_9GLOM|nr:hypothetical protein C1645_834893 [Glomus cerebriforme]
MVSDISNISHNLDDLERLRYMALEKLLFNDEDHNNYEKKKKVPYDSKCEIYWKRASEKYSLPFSDDIPIEWKSIITRAREYEPRWHRNKSDLCHNFYNLNSKKKALSYADLEILSINEYSEDYDKNLSIVNNQSVIPSSYITIKILSVDDAIHTHKSKNENRNKQLAWQSEGVKANSIEALKYLKLAADSGNSVAIYIILKAYWNGGNGIENIKGMELNI